MSTVIRCGAGYVIAHNPVDFDRAPDKLDEQGRTPKEAAYAEAYLRLINATFTNDVTECRQVIEEGFREVTAPSFKLTHGWDGASPFFIAWYYKHREIYALFLEAVAMRKKKNCVESHNP